jgi:hypothetical protein
MTSNYLISFLMVILKHFFDIEREVTYHIVTTVAVRVHDFKDLFANLVMLHK